MTSANSTRSSHALVTNRSFLNISITGIQLSRTPWNPPAPMSHPGNGPLPAGLEHPLTPGYPECYGISPENVTRADVIETGKLIPGTPLVTREAPPAGPNPGGGIEVIVPPNTVTVGACNIL